MAGFPKSGHIYHSMVKEVFNLPPLVLKARHLSGSANLQKHYVDVPERWLPQVWDWLWKMNLLSLVFISINSLRTFTKSPHSRLSYSGYFLNPLTGVQLQSTFATIYEKPGIWDKQAMRAMCVFSTSGQTLSNFRFFHIHVQEPFFYLLSSVMEANGKLLRHLFM